MTTATVRAVIKRFIESPDPEVLALKGPWGGGKTYAWRQLIGASKESAGLPSYSYVSLFGIGSIAELRLAIYTKTQAVKTLGNKMTAASMNENWLEYGKRGAKALGEIVARARDIPIVKNMTVGFDVIAPHLISNTLVCLDDFERLSNRLSAEEVLGFISSLKEEKSCKIVLIFNDQRLAEKTEIYRRYREKLVDLEVLYQPSPKEAAEIAFSKSASWYAQTLDKSVSLCITNIRLLRKIERLVTLVWPQIQGLHQAVLDQAIGSIVLLSWCYYEPDDSKPTLEFLRKFDSMGFAVKKHAQEKKGLTPDPKESSWENLLDAYSFNRMDEFDLALLKAVEHGYTEESGLETHAKKLDGYFKAADAEKSFTKAWSMFHDTFANNESELIAALRDSFKQSVMHISPVNANGTVKLMRELHRDDVADELIDYYVTMRNSETELFDLENHPFAGDITDSQLRAKFSEKFKNHNPLPALSDAALRIGKGSWGGRDEQALDAATEDQLYALFKQDHGDNLHRIVKGVLRLTVGETHAELRKRTRASLEKISSESTVNALRVARYLK